MRYPLDSFPKAGQMKKQVLGERPFIYDSSLAPAHGALRPARPTSRASSASKDARSRWGFSPPQSCPSSSKC